jgi:hypothetical protein
MQLKCNTFCWWGLSPCHILNYHFWYHSPSSGLHWYSPTSLFIAIANEFTLGNLCEWWDDDWLPLCDRSGIFFCFNVLSQKWDLGCILSSTAILVMVHLTIQLCLKYQHGCYPGPNVIGVVYNCCPKLVYALFNRQKQMQRWRWYLGYGEVDGEQFTTPLSA